MQELCYFVFGVIDMTTGERIKQRRKQLGLSCEQLADRFGVSASTMYRYENGYIEKLPVQILAQIAKELGTTPAWLMGWDDETEPEPPQELTPKQLALIEQIRHLTDQQVDAILTLLKAQSDLQDPVD